MTYSYQIMQRRNLPFEFIRLLDPQPDRVVWDKSKRGYALLTPAGLRFGLVRYNTHKARRGLLAVIAWHFVESSDPEGRFAPTAGGNARVCWLSIDDKPAVEYALAVLQASYLERETHKASDEGKPVVIKFWPGRPGIEDFGIVHLVGAKKCGYTNNLRGGRWEKAENVRAADEKYPEHRLFWCAKCFGYGNPRRFDWRKYGNVAK